MKMIVMLVALFVLVGCNTVEGLGKDVSKLGDKIEHKASHEKAD